MAHRPGSDFRGRGGWHGLGGSHRPPQESRIVVALRELVRVGAVRELQDLVAASDMLDPSGAAGTFLRESCAGRPLHLALEKLSVQESEAAWRQQTALIAAARAGPVAAILPFPPHLLELLADAAVSLVSLDHHEPPPVRLGRAVTKIHDAFTAAAAVEAAAVVLVDGFEADGLFLRRTAVRLLDPRTLRPDAVVFIHLRPHRDSDDEPAHPALASRLHPI